MKIIAIVPVFNGESFIDRCLSSLLRQTYQDFEAYIVDDGSTDNTQEVLRKYKSDPKFHILKKENGGAGSARNYALDLINEKDAYIVFIDSDDCVKDNYFELLSNHDEEIVFIDVEQRDENNNLLKEERISVYRNETKDSILRKQMTGFIPWGGVRKATKSNVIIDNHIRFSNTKVGEEALYSFNALYFAKSIGFIHECVYSYNVRNDSLSGTFNEDPWGKVTELMEENLKQLGIYDQYADTLNSFKISSNAVSLRRIGKYKYSEFKAKAKEARIKLMSSLDNAFGIDKKSLSKKANLIWKLVKAKMYFSIFALARLSGV